MPIGLCELSTPDNKVTSVDIARWKRVSQAFSEVRTCENLVSVLLHVLFHTQTSLNSILLVSAVGGIQLRSNI